jgi:hypothetical protein
LSSPEVSPLSASYVAFGGGEPLGVPYCWELFELLADGGVPLDGKVKLLNAPPFAPADLRHESLAQARQAYCAARRATEVREFISKYQTDPGLLRHANETWGMGMKQQQTMLRADPSWKSP